MKKLEKNDPNLNLKIGLIFFEEKYYDDAIREFREILISQGNSDQARFFLAAALEEKGDLKAAGKEYQHIGRQSDSYIPARLRLAQILARQKKFKEGIKIIQEALTVAPKQGELYVTLAMLYEEEGQSDKAIETLQQALETSLNPVEVYFRLAIIYDKKKDRDESLRNIKKVLEREPKNPEALNFLGYLYADMGTNLDEAEKLIQAALREKPDAGYIIDSLGWVYYKKGLFDQAIKELERAAAKMPQDGTIAEHLGDAYAKKQRYKEALKIYKRALTLENASKPEVQKKIKQTEEILQGKSR
jgi:tetratricopeptide (TPR) repeat protein